MKIRISNTEWPIRICRFEKSSYSYAADPNNLLVKNIHKSISSREFYELFYKYGDIKSCKLELERDGSSKGYGYVTFYNTNDTIYAMNKLNGQDIKGQKIEIAHLVAQGNKGNNNVIYIKHLSPEFTEKDLTAMFKQYGDITSASLKKDKTGKNTGVAIVAYSDYRSAAAAVSEFKLKPTTFPGQPPVYVDYLQKKEERAKLNVMNTKFDYNKSRVEPTVLFAKFIDPSLIANLEELVKYLRLFIKIVMKSEYQPLNIDPNYDKSSALVTFRNKKEADAFMNNYKLLTQPEFFFDFVPQNPLNSSTNLNITRPNQGYSHYQEMNQMNNQFQGMNINQIPKNPYGNNQMNHMNQMPYKPNYNNPHPIQTPPIQGNFNPNIQIPQDFNSMNKEDLSNYIYDVVNIKYPHYASKITGMIIDMGENEMKKLLNNPTELDNIINEAYTVSIINLSQYFRCLQ